MTMKKLQVVLLCAPAASAYGVVHDQITARVCLEYFTVAHPPLFPTHSVTLLACYWGIAATLGLGVVLGLVLALVSQAGPPPAIRLRRLMRSIVLLVVVIATDAVLAGVLGYGLSQRHLIFLPQSLAGVTPARLHDHFLAVWFAHLASYLVGLAGAALLCYRTWLARGQPVVISLFPPRRQCFALAPWSHSFARP